jgi:hypothetical protein
LGSDYTLDPLKEETNVVNVLKDFPRYDYIEDWLKPKVGEVLYVADHTAFNPVSIPQVRDAFGIYVHPNAAPGNLGEFSMQPCTVSNAGISIRSISKSKVQDRTLAACVQYELLSVDQRSCYLEVVHASISLRPHVSGKAARPRRLAGSPPRVPE